MAIRVEDVMTRDVITCSPDASVQEIACIIRDRNISSVVVSDGAELKGIVTQHDLVGRVIAEGLDYSVKASEVMSRDVETISPEAEIEEAARLMRDKRIKKLVVVRKGEVMGIVTSFDLIVAEPVIRLLVDGKI